MYRLKNTRILSVLLAAAMLATLFSTTVSATEGSGEPADTTPPAFAAGSPSQASGQTAGTRQVGVSIQAQEAVHYYYVALPNNAAAPSAAQVMAGHDAANQAALAFGGSGTDKYSSVSVYFILPEHNTDYDVWVVIRDDAGNTAGPARADVKTPPPADFFSAGYPKPGAIQAAGSKEVQVLVKVQNTYADAKIYYVLLPDGAAAPSTSQVGKGKDSAGNAAPASGTADCAKGTEQSFTVSCPADGTPYDLYLVAGDTQFANPLGKCTGPVKVDVITPLSAPAANIMEIGSTGYATVDGALAAVTTGQTIRLLTNINYSGGITVSGKKITFDLNGHEFNVVNPSGDGLSVKDGGSVGLTGAGLSGEFNVTGVGYGVHVSGETSHAAVTNATATAFEYGCGAYAYRGAISVAGNVTSMGNYSNGARSYYGTVTIGGNARANGFGSFGIYAEGGSICVAGNVTASANNSAGVHCSGTTVTVDGTITAGYYIRIVQRVLAKSAGVPDEGKPGYLKYSAPDQDAAAAVWVKMADAEKVAAAKAALTFDLIKGHNSNETNILENLALPASGLYGTSIAWSSDAPGVISASGTVTRPSAGAGDQAVKLTARISAGSLSDTLVFNLTVKQQASGSVSSRPQIGPIISDPRTGVTYDLSGAGMPAGVTGASVWDSVVSEGSADYSAVLRLINGNAELGGLKHLMLYELKLLDQNGNPIPDFTGKIRVKIPIPSGMRGDLRVFWYDSENGALSDMNAVQENGFLVFETTHFSYYAIAQLSASSASSASSALPVSGVESSSAASFSSSGAVSSKGSPVSSAPASAGTVSSGTVSSGATSSGTVSSAAASPSPGTGGGSFPALPLAAALGAGSAALAAVIKRKKLRNR